jgi:hypothetical protein
VSKGVTYDRVHDLLALKKLTEPHVSSFPAHADMVTDLTLFAVKYRYENVPEDERLSEDDFMFYLKLATGFQEWANNIVNS